MKNWMGLTGFDLNLTNSRLRLGEPERDYMGMELSENVTTSDYLGLGGGTWEAGTI